MLRRPLTVLAITAEDIADYEDRAADRARARDLAAMQAAQARLRRDALAAHQQQKQQPGGAPTRRRVLNHPNSDDESRGFPYARQPTEAFDADDDGDGDEVEEEEEEDGDDMDVDGGMDMGMGMQTTPTMQRGQQQQQVVAQQRRAEEQERVLRGQQAAATGSWGTGRTGGSARVAASVTPEARVQRTREERIGVAAPQRRRQQG
jgi:hypothetical protein